MTHLILNLIETVATIGLVSSAAYYFLCLWSARNFLREQMAEDNLSPQESRPQVESVRIAPPISILKPLKGADPEMYESFRSHCRQDYPEYEIIFGVSDPDDPAIESVKALQREFPDRRMQLVVCGKLLGPNVKVSNLEQMLPQARYDVLVVNDSDIRVEPSYLRRVSEPLAEPGVGMVTCLYRGIASLTLGSRLEALGISTDFCPSVLAARSLEGIRFGLGSTLAFRRGELEKIGGFASFADYLADDYELGKRIAGLGLEIRLSTSVVETYLPAYTFWEFLRHQLRWARGIRDARPNGYLGLPFTFGIFWGLVAVGAGRGSWWAWSALAFIFLLRLAIAWVVGRKILSDSGALRNAWLIPFRDLIAVAVWVASLAGHTVTWRGTRFHLRNGKLSRKPL